MRSFIESLSLTSGAIVIAVLSTALVWLLCALCPVRLRKLWVVIVPFVLAYCLYWFPVWLGADDSEYGAWAIAGVGGWFLAGAVPSAVLVIMLGRRGAK